MVGAESVGCTLEGRRFFSTNFAADFELWGAGGTMSHTLSTNSAYGTLLRCSGKRGCTTRSDISTL